MENQHTLIKGYRDLSAEEIAAMNKIKELGAQVGALVEEMEFASKLLSGPEARWVAIGKTHLQQGFMALTRSVAKPDSF